MKYKPRFHRTKDGNYQCLYGKGRKTIEGQIWKRSNTNWLVYDTDESFKRLADAKTRWGGWAAEQYEHKNSIPPVPQRRTSSPPLSDTAGSASDADFESADSEPKHIRWFKPPGHVNRSVPENDASHVTPPTPAQAIHVEPDHIQKSNDNPFLADPFKPGAYVDGRPKELTALGACLEVYNWMESRLDRMARSGKYPWQSIVEVLQRAYPDDPRFF